MNTPSPRSSPFGSPRLPLREHLQSSQGRQHESELGLPPFPDATGQYQEQTVYPINISSLMSAPGADTDDNSDTHPNDSPPNLRRRIKPATGRLQIHDPASSSVPKAPALPATSVVNLNTPRPNPGWFVKVMQFLNTGDFVDLYQYEKDELIKEIQGYQQRFEHEKLHLNMLSAFQPKIAFTLAYTTWILEPNTDFERLFLLQDTKALLQAFIDNDRAKADQYRPNVQQWIKRAGASMGIREAQEKLRHDLHNNLEPDTIRALLFNNLDMVKELPNYQQTAVYCCYKINLYKKKPSVQHHTPGTPLPALHMRIGDQMLEFSQSDHQDNLLALASMRSILWALANGKDVKELTNYLSYNFGGFFMLIPIEADDEVPDSHSPQQLLKQRQDFILPSFSRLMGHGR